MNLSSCLPTPQHNIPSLMQQTPSMVVVVTRKTHSLPMIKFGVSLRSHFVTLGSTSLLSSVVPLHLSRRSFDRRQEFEPVVSTNTRGLMSFRVRLVQTLLVSISSFRPPFSILMVVWSTRHWSCSPGHQERPSFRL